MTSKTLKNGGQLSTETLARRRSRISTFTAIAVAGLTISLTCPAKADLISNISNGDFEQLQPPGSGSSLLSPTGVMAVDWTTSGLVWAYLPNPGTTSGTTADTTVPTGFALKGPGNGNPNGLTVSPNGGNFVGLSGSSNPGSISQPFNGLTPGVPVDVTFEWAAAQQVTANGENNQTLQVTVCPGTSATCSSPTFTMPFSKTNTSGGFNGWTPVAFAFTPTSSAAVLSFSDSAQQSGNGPVSLLDSVTATQIPEPSTWSLLGISFAALGGVARLCRVRRGSERRSSDSAALPHQRV